jgi:hypothetical protein
MKTKLIIGLLLICSVLVGQTKLVTYKTINYHLIVDKKFPKNAKFVMHVYTNDSSYNKKDTLVNEEYISLIVDTWNNYSTIINIDVYYKGSMCYQKFINVKNDFSKLDGYVARINWYPRYKKM